MNRQTAKFCCFSKLVCLARQEKQGGSKLDVGRKYIKMNVIVLLSRNEQKLEWDSAITRLSVEGP